MSTTLGVCVPVRNMVRTIRATLCSIADQLEPPATTVYIVDGDSRDGTLDIVREFIHYGEVTAPDSRVAFEVISRPDNNMYDAVADGLSELSRKCDVLSWLNADDVLLPNALRGLAEVYDSDGSVEWTLHPVVQFDDDGNLLYAGPAPTIWGSWVIANGFHDGQTFPMLPQEAMSWRGQLWSEIREFPQSLRLAGDFWLWREFARNGHSPTPVGFPLGAFRRRPGQLSDGDSYGLEVSLCHSSEWGVPGGVGSLTNGSADA